MAMIYKPVFQLSNEPLIVLKIIHFNQLLFMLKPSRALALKKRQSQLLVAMDFHSKSMFGNSIFRSKFCSSNEKKFRGTFLTGS